MIAMMPAKQGVRLSLSHWSMALVAVAAFWASCLVPGTALAGRKMNDYRSLWRAVSKADDKGLPKTAVKALGRIVTAARRNHDYPMELKALVARWTRLCQNQEEAQKKRILLAEKELSSSSAKIKPLLHAVLANWYFQYYNQNRWKFRKRSVTSGTGSDDFSTWDLARLFRKIGWHYEKALKPTRWLKRMKAELWSDFLEKPSTTLTARLRPTLYDFIAHEAIGFYANADQPTSRKIDAYDMDCQSGVLAPREDFVSFRPDTSDTDSPLVKALKLYQSLLKLHMADGNEDALVAVDLERLDFAREKSFGGNKDELYLAALDRIGRRDTDSPLASMAYWKKARLLKQKGRFTEAKQAAEKGLELHPRSVGGHNCKALIAGILAKELSLACERAAMPGKAAIAVTYRNITKVYVRVYREDWRYFLHRRYSPRPDVFPSERCEELLKTGRPVLEKEFTLPATTDYRQMTRELSLEGLKSGFYRLVASWRPDFGKRRENRIAYTSMWVSGITFVTRSGEGVIDGLVVDSRTGEPVRGAKILALAEVGDKWKKRVLLVTDGDGRFSLDRKSTGGNSVLIMAERGRDRCILPWSVYPGYRGKSSPRTSVSLFTDRAIYRPGQTIYFKGILHRCDTENDSYSVLPGKSFNVTLYDRNGRKIASRKVTTNEFGSFDGSFTAPSGTVTGRTSIGVSRYGGRVYFRVEEYKRPSFIVQLDKPGDGARLGAKVTASGKAVAYTGAPIDGARVRYRVVRKVRWPYWYCFWWAPAPSPSQEIAHGTVRTGADGGFSIPFEARPDPSIAPEKDPSFDFEVSVDVIDRTGETHSASTVLRLGYTALQARMSVPDWAQAGKPLALAVSTGSLDGIPLSATGRIEIFRLVNPAGRPVPASFFGVTGRRKANQRTADPARWQSWKQGRSVFSSPFTCGSDGRTSVSVSLKAGAYRAVLSTTDRYGKAVKAYLPFLVTDPSASRLSIPLTDLVRVKSSTVEVGSTLEALWGTGYDSGRAYIEVVHRGRVVKAFWTAPGRTQHLFRMPVTERYRGGFTLSVTFVRENRLYRTSKRISVPWTNKKLVLAFSSFRSTLKPGERERWTVKIKGPGAWNRAAELMAAMYDASLDSFVKHSWSDLSGLFRRDYSRRNTVFPNSAVSFDILFDDWNRYYSTSSYERWRFPDDVTRYLSGPVCRMYMCKSAPMRGAVGAALPCAEMAECDGAVPSAPAPMARESKAKSPSADKVAALNGLVPPGARRKSAPSRRPDLDRVKARGNLAETALWKPSLHCKRDGTVTIEFKAPDTLTEWRFMALAHGKGLESGLLLAKAVTRKELMVTPTAPRFLREKDLLRFSAKVVNMSGGKLKGLVRLDLRNALTGKACDEVFGLKSSERSFELEAGRSKAVFWTLRVPVGAPPVVYRVVASTGRLSDGEEGSIPVLSSRMLVTESLPLPIRGPAVKKFRFDKLLKSAESDTISQYGLTVQVVSNPAWYAVQALPYLMEYPYECSEQVFNRFYANTLAGQIAGSSPKIRRVFDEWAKDGSALESPLAKNQKLKSALLVETPWLLDAKNETEARHRVGVLFNSSRIASETAGALKKLAGMQLPSGAWPWFPGGRENEFITLYVMTGFGRLRHLEASVDFPGMRRCLAYCDQWLRKRYEYLVRKKLLGANNLSPSICLYIYGRSFFTDTVPVASRSRRALEYFLGQARAHWTDMSLMSQGHLALGLKRFGDRSTPADIVASLRERALHSDEMGMYWAVRDSWWWYRAPIETQAMMIEVFDEVARDEKAVDDCQVWLLKQKQTQRWPTTKSTADAVYALLMRGTDLLSSDRLVRIELGGRKIEPGRVEAGTGFYEKTFPASQVKPDMGDIVLRKEDKGVAWASVHWQYFEDISKITGHKTGLALEKSIFVERRTDSGPVIEPVSGKVLHPGDLLKVRIVLRSDRDLEFVHMRDHRGSGTEPTNVLSRYRYQDGLAYYESTRDTATDFFIDYLPKGTYVFEYPLRVVHCGRYQSGMATIQCMYAPEFNSHSASVELKVTPSK